MGIAYTFLGWFIGLGFVVLWIASRTPKRRNQMRVIPEPDEPIRVNPYKHTVPHANFYSVSYGRMQRDLY